MKRLLIWVLMGIGFVIAIRGIFVFIGSNSFSAEFFGGISLFASGYYIFKMSLKWHMSERQKRKKSISS